MRKFLKILLLMAFMLPFAMHADEITIGTGTTSGYNSPFNNPKNYSWTECIYPASSIGGACIINSIAYDCANASSQPYKFKTLKIYIGETTRLTHESDFDWTPENDLTLVYSGTDVIPGSSTGWRTFTLDNPYTYEGVNNLVIVVSKIPATTFSFNPISSWYYTSTANACMYRRNIIDPSFANYPKSTGTRSDNLANVQLNVTPLTITCYRPTAIVADTTTPTTASVSWTPYTGTSAWDVYITNDGVSPTATTTPTASNLTSTSYTFTGLTGGTVYSIYVRTNCGGGDVSTWKGISLMTEPDFSGNGTAESPYLIYSKADIESLNNVISRGWTTCDKYFKVMHDINGITEPIANAIYPFSGDFDGNEHTIDVNLNGAGYQGLFASIGPGANIHDVTVDGSIVSTGSNAGGIVAYVYTYGNDTDTADMYISNCVNKVNINCSAGRVGGIVGWYHGSFNEKGSHLVVKGCTNKGDIIGNVNFYGGIAGQLGRYCVVDNCINKGNVIGKGSSAGIVGQIDKYSIVTNSSNKGNLTVKGNDGGGIVGRNLGNVYNCYNTGNIATNSNSKQIGGVVGLNYPNCYVENVYFSGTLSANNTINCGAVVGYNNNGYINNAFYKSGSFAVAYGSSSNANYISYVSSFTQDEDDPTICTLESPGYGGSTDLRTTLNYWRAGNIDYNEWFNDIYGNNYYLPTFVIGIPPGLEITPKQLSMGPRPIGAWMHAEELTLTNTGQVPVIVSALDFANSNFFILDENENNPELPLVIEEEGEAKVYITTDPQAAVSTGNISGSLVAIWGTRSIAMSDITATAYEPVVPDVVETPAVVSSFPYTTTQNTSTIHDNYYLPGENIDALDGVYKLTFTTEVSFNAEITEGNHPKLALYAEDFGEEPGPGANNYYTGPVIGAGGGSEFLFDQSEMITHPGQGAGGADVSAICGGGTLLGHSANWASGNGSYFLLADDFALDSLTTITDMEFYAYQSGSSVISTMTGLYIQIYDDSPMQGGQVIWGDNATNLMSSTEWTGIYRTSASNLLQTDRPIMKIKATGLNVNLEAGTYWIQVGFTGSLSNGPWGNPRCIWNQATSGNGLQKTSDGWIPWVDAGQQGLPMILSSGSRREFALSPNAQASNIDEGSTEIADVMTFQEIANMLETRDDYPVSYGGDNPITNLTLTPGTYYLVASSTSAQYILNINPETIPVPLEPIVIYPLNGQQEVSTPIVNLQWTFGQFTTEYQLLLGTTYPPTEVIQDWTSDLADTYLVGGLLNNKNYFWRVNERNSSGSTTGPVWGFTTALNVPQDLTVNDNINANLYPEDDAVLSWTAVNDRSHRGYNIYQDGVKLNEAPVTQTTYTVEDLTYNMDPGYTFNVTAVYDEGESPFSNNAVARMTGNGIVSGKVFEQDETTPVEGATVTLQGFDEYNASQTFTFTTNGSGAYSGPVLAGVYHAHASINGYQNATYNGIIIIVYDEETPDIDFALDEVFTPVGEVIAEEIDSSMVKLHWSWEMMSMLVEDFETGDFSKYEWDNTVTPNSPWEVTTTNPYEGAYCMKSGCAGVSVGSSSIQITVDVPYDGAMSFYQRISSEANWDKGYFYIDGVQKSVCSGNVEWQYREYDVSEGEHTYKWNYTKDYSFDMGEDTYYIDYITFYQPVEPFTGGWIYYDDGTYTSSVGANGSPMYWGISFPNTGEYAGMTLSKIAYYEKYAGTITANIYLGGTTAPGTLVATQDFTCGSSGSIIEIDLDNPVVIDGTQPLWITCYNSGSIAYPASGCTYCGDPNSCWVSLDGASWDPVTNYGLNYTWILRGYVSNERGKTVMLTNAESVNSYYGSTLEFHGGTGSGDFVVDNGEPHYYGLPERGNRGMNRSFQYYVVYRTDCYNEDYSFENIELLSSHVTDTVYMDMSWANMDAGVYKWGVSAVYGGNRESDRGWNKPVTDVNTNIQPAFDVERSLFTKIDIDNNNNVPLNLISSFSVIDGEKSNLDGTWLYYDDGTRVNAIGTGRRFYWGVMFPASMMSAYAGTTITKIKVFDYQAGAATINISYGGKTAPGTLIHTQNFSFAGAQDWLEFDLTSPFPIDGNENVWVTFYSDARFPAAVSNDISGDPNGRWMSMDGSSWEDLANYGFNYTWMIRAYVKENSGPGPGFQERESPIIWSNCLDKDMYTTVDISVMTNSGDSPEGTSVSFVNISEPEMELIYDVTLDSTGYYEWDGFRKGTYLLTVALDGFTSCATEDTVAIWDVTSIECMLEEIINYIGDLYVSPTGWSMWNDSGTPPTPPGPPISEWLYYDDGTYANAIGANGTIYWGVMFPASSMSAYAGTGMTKIKVFDYQGGAATANIYYGGSNAPATLVHTQNFNFTGAQDWLELSLTSPLPIDGTENVWVTFYQSGAAFPAAVSNDVSGDPNGRWVSTNGVSWMDLAAAGLPGYTFMVRAYVTNEAKGGKIIPLEPFKGNISTGELSMLPVSEMQIKNTDNIPATGSRGTDAFQYYKVMLDGILEADNVVNNYYQHDVTNLVAGQQYTTSVAAVYSTGMSGWSEYTWTYVPCENFDGALSYTAENIEGDAVLTWTLPNSGGGGGGGGTGDEFFYDFEDGTLGDWTTIDADGDGNIWMNSNDLIGAGYGYNGSQYCVLSASYINYQGPLTPDNYLVSPQVNIGGSSTFSFRVCAQDAGYPAEHYGVAISATGNTSAADFETIWEETLTAKNAKGQKGPRGTNAQGTWYEKTVNLSAYSGQQVYIALRHFNCSDNFYIDVDDVTLSAGSKSTRAPWDLMTSFNANGGGEQGIATDGEYIYTATWAGHPGYDFGKYDMDGTFIEGFSISGASGVRDLTYDGTYFYGSSGASSIYILDLANKTKTGQITLQGESGSRHLSYDPVNDGFWCGGWHSLALYDRNGAKVQDGPAPESAYGSGYFTDENNEAHLYLFCQPNSDAKVYDYNITTNTLGTSPIFDFSATPGYVGGSSSGISGGAFIGEYEGKTAFFGNVQQDPNLVGIYELSEGTAPTPPSPVGGILGVMVFRDGELLTPTPITELTYTDVTPGTGEYEYCIRVVYGAEEYDSTWYAMSCPQCETVSLEIMCDAPEDLYGEYTWNENGIYGATLIWPYEAPVPPTSEWLYYDDGTAVSAIGAGGTIYWGVMFPASSMSAYAGTGMTKIKVFDYKGGAATANIYYGGSNAPATLVHTQNFNFTGAQDWLELDLTSPLPIDGTENVWVTFYQSGTDFPAAVSNDVSNDPNGRWVSLDGLEWMDAASAGVPGYTFMVRAYVTNEAKGGETVALAPFQGEKGGELTAKILDEPIVTRGERELDHYNLYRSTDNSNYELIDDNAASPYFDDLTGEAGSYYYQVTAVYIENGQECESDPANAYENPEQNYVMVEVTSISENNADNMVVYPNPTNGDLHIEAEGMSRISISNILGQMVYDQEVGNDNKVIDMSQFGEGVYMVRIVTENGVAVKRITVIR